ncbi:flavin-containing monooxygenase [Coralliovum pocilloporae]|uniref:flavin-containing monooxygenase n=1 Tax=Coralliovum pocilloporae TaxID=3066369 RepID=UPI003307C293
MPIEKIDTLVVGAGQAGIAVSEHLSNNNVPHLILEKNRVAEAWRSGRWDGLVANGPAWHDRFPNLQFEDCDPDSFPSKERVADYLNDYAKMIKAPIRTGIEVTSAKRLPGQGGFLVETSDGSIEANRIVAATGAFQHPVIPPVVPSETAVEQLHSFYYRNPRQLPDGAVMVVGAGSSGAQIADELNRAGRKVFLSIGPHDRPPRSYRGRDFVWWLGVLGLWDLAAMEPGKEHVTISVSGAYGGRTMDFRRLAGEGVTLLGMTQSFANGTLSFAEDLKDNIANGDADYTKMLDAADAYVARTGIDLPEEPEARKTWPDPDCLTNPIKELNLAEEGITSIIWATGFRQDFSWMHVDAFDDRGAPVHQRGVSSEPGIYFLGLPWQSRRGSTFIWGVWHDAKHIADQIAIQRMYQDYRAPSERNSEAAE